MSMTIFAVVDPTTETQWALNRAILITKLYGAPDDKVHAFLCAYSNADAADEEALKRVVLDRHSLWLDKILQQTDTQGVQVETQIIWEKDWRDAIAMAAEEAGAYLIIKSTYSRSAGRRRLRKNSDKQLLRAAHCPVLLVKSDKFDDKDPVLMALDMGANDEAHQRLNERIIRYANRMREARGGKVDLHVVNVYSGSEDYVRPPDIAKKVSVDLDRVHVVQGPPEKGILEVTRTIQPAFVIIGTVARRGLAAATFGNTVERVLESVDADVLTIVHSPAWQTKASA